MSKYDIVTDLYETGEENIGEIGHFKIRHKSSDYTGDHYAIEPDFLACGHQTADHNRPGTKMLLDGIWVPSPDNPGLYGRTYGDEMYRHVPWVVSARTAYNSKVAKFKPCKQKPSHACLGTYPADGSVQFRGDLHGLRPLN